MIATIRRRLLEFLREDVGARIFYQKSPDDVRLEDNYPQIILELDKFYDAAHGTDGILTALIICSTSSTPPELLERKIKKALDGTFFNSNCLLKWQKSELFQEPASERLPMILGMEIEFALYELPDGLTEEPDLILAFWDWAAHFEASLIGVAHFDYFEPTINQPALYFSVESIKLQRQTPAAVFLLGEIKIHLFAPEISARRRWLSSLYRELLFIKALRLRDGSVARLEDIEYMTNADEISGQIRLTVEYGAARRFIKTHGLKPILDWKDMSDYHVHDNRTRQRGEDSIQPA